MNEIVTLAETLIPLIRELRHTTENDRRIAEPLLGHEPINPLFMI
jgi:hypothetical protein